MGDAGISVSPTDPYATQVDPRMVESMRGALDYALGLRGGRGRRAVKALQTGYFGARAGSPESQLYFHQARRDEDEARRRVRELLSFAGEIGERRDQATERELRKRDRAERDRANERVDLGTYLDDPVFRGNFATRAEADKIKLQRTQRQPEALTGIDLEAYEDTVGDRAWQEETRTQTREGWQRDENEYAAGAGLRTARRAADMADAKTDLAKSDATLKLLELVEAGKGPGDPEFDAATALIRAAAGGGGSGRTPAEETASGMRYRDDVERRVRAQYESSVSLGVDSTDDYMSLLGLQMPPGTSVDRNAKVDAPVVLVPRRRGEKPSVKKLRTQATSEELSWLQEWIDDEVLLQLTESGFDVARPASPASRIQLPNLPPPPVWQ